jgi:fructokinase
MTYDFHAPPRGEADAPRRPVLVGEVLFDVFPDGREVPGGAPFNVAWNLKGLGFSPLFLSRVGVDDRGAEVRRLMGDWGLDLRGLQHDPLRPTGEVRIRIENGEPSYTIVPDQAWDRLDGAVAAEAWEPVSRGILYRGTLAGRSADGARALEAVERGFPGPLFVDLNLRSPWWEIEQVRRICARASVLKVNQEEWDVVSASPDPVSPITGDPSAGPQLLAVTRGGDGAWLRQRGAVLAEVPAPAPESFEDAVGAGDAFSAVIIAGLIRGWKPKMLLRRAVDFAARVCSLRGATTDDLSFYARVRGLWESEDARS